MKNLIIVLTLLMNLPIYGQESTKGIEFHSVSFSPANIYFNSETVGFGMNLELGINRGKHIFKLYAGAASELVYISFGEPILDNYEEINLMYGQEFNIKKWFGIDLFIGAGYFNYHFDKGSSYGFKKEAIGIPLQSKVRFTPGRVFSLGLQLHGNVNTASSIFQPGIFLQWYL